MQEMILKSPVTMTQETILSELGSADKRVSAQMPTVNTLASMYMLPINLQAEHVAGTSRGWRWLENQVDKKADEDEEEPYLSGRLRSEPAGRVEAVQREKKVDVEELRHIARWPAT
ncbi:hypothetical protein ACLOJK_021144 [Asimina triloba]